ncbi:Transcriptional regulator, TetR family [[Actinomadura] parvosata subsp. kistnae]|uniref:TetR/AcrR family transcriptional regulator n=1 Tax=[Actinomadura] parvosata TaxID=1955412 RepID=UPI000D2781A0|nr:Transcriptional regulator, TetR family [Actinomadura parvosata subsp. kistnae]
MEEKGGEGWAPVMRFSERSAPTRRAILEAARTRFAKDGYDRATIRAIAADAGVSAAMVVRYFGSKADLFALTTRAGFLSLDLTHVPVREIGRRFVRAALEPWERGDDEAMAALHRSATTHEDSAKAVQGLLTHQVLPVLKAAFPDDPGIEAKAALVHAQGLGVIVGRYLLRLEPLASMDFDALVACVGDSVQRYLDA